MPALDVGQRAMTQRMEAEEFTLETGNLLPLSEQVAKRPGRKPSSPRAGKKRVRRSEPLLAAEELVELADDGVGEKNVLSTPASTVPLEDFESDATLDPSVSAEDVPDVQRDNLVAPETGSKCEGNDHVISKATDPIPSDGEDFSLLGGSETSGSGSDLADVGGHREPPEKDSGNSKPVATILPKVAILSKAGLDDYRVWISSELGFMTAFGRFEEEPIRFEAYQERFLLEHGQRFRSVEKARQIGFSFLFACEAVARCHLRESHTSIFVSYNLEDAKEKILYARQLAEELPFAYRKKITTDSKTELAFRSVDGKTESRIISNPSKAPRGKKGDLYLDELAHYTFDRDVYKGSTALIARANNQLSICSTPLGRRGTFWEIARQELRPYPRYWRQRVPWWLCSFFCIDINAAHELSPTMPTEDRVRRFGTMALQDQFDALMIEDFQQEFELDYIDESYSFYPYDLILPCTYDVAERGEITGAGASRLYLADDPTEFPKIRGRLTAGYDVGRKRDLSVLSVFEDVDNTKKCRMLKVLDRVPFAVQEAELRRVLDILPIARMSIDQNGIGMQLAENLKNDFDQIDPVTFTNDSKEIMAHDFKILLQRRDIMMPKDRALVSEIHSIKRKLTATGKPQFESEGLKGRGHADRFWSVVLACRKERDLPKPQETYEVACRVIG